MYLTNGLLWLGVGIAMIGQSLTVICIGRFIWGTAFGTFSVICAKYVNEITPVEYKGQFGAINQLLLTLGACIPATLALAYPRSLADLSSDDFMISGYWRCVWCAPLIISTLQVTLLYCFFNHETPAFLVDQEGRQGELLAVMRKFY